jgi:hypothetical protein
MRCLGPLKHLMGSIRVRVSGIQLWRRYARLANPRVPSIGEEDRVVETQDEVQGVKDIVGRMGREDEGVGDQCQIVYI